MQIVTNLVDSPLLGFGQIPLAIESILLKEKTDLVAASQEVVVANVVMAVVATSGEAGHGVILEGEVGEKGVCLVQEALDGGRAQSIRDDEVAISLEGGDLVGGQAARDVV